MKSAIVVVSDLHVGSYSGLMPADGIRLDNGACIMPSSVQQMLIDFWRHFWETFVPTVTKGCKKIQAVINGDVIDGNHHGAVDLIPNVNDQRRGAIAMLRPIRERYPLAIVRGTEAHGGVSDQDTEAVAQALETVKDDGTGNYSWWQYWLECAGVTFQFAHHIGTTSSAAYETSAPMRELVAGLVENSQWGLPMANVYVRSHRHRYIPVMIPAQGDKDIALYITPAWQLRTPHIERIDRMRLPHIGGLVFVCEDGKCQAIKKLYEMPKPTVNQM